MQKPTNYFKVYRRSQLEKSTQNFVGDLIQIKYESSKQYEYKYGSILLNQGKSKEDYQYCIDYNIKHGNLLDAERIATRYVKIFDDAESYYELGKIYSVLKRYDEAKTYFKLSYYRYNHQKSRIFIKNNYGVDEINEELFTTIETKDGNEKAIASYKLAINLLVDNDMKFVNYLKSAAELGYPPAMINLKLMYEYGYFVEADHYEANILEEKLTKLKHLQRGQDYQTNKDIIHEIRSKNRTNYQNQLKTSRIVVRIEAP